MKNLILTAAMFGFILCAGAQQVITSEEVKVGITGETSREDLMHLRQDMLVQGVDFQYNPVFDMQRKLIGISVMVKAGEVEGQAEVKDLNQPGKAMVIHLQKNTEGKFAITCLGKCPVE